jgi:hypothetical protein
MQLAAHQACMFDVSLQQSAVIGRIDSSEDFDIMSK